MLFGARVFPERYLAEFHLPMPKSWSQKKKNAMCSRPHQQKPDVDNLLKALQDSLCGKCDAHVWDARGIKVWDTSGFIEIFEIGDDLWDFWIR